MAVEKEGTTLTVIYVDLLFGLNIILDWILLRMTAKIRRLQTSQRRIVVATGIGAAYAAVLFIPSYSILYTYIGKLFLSMVITFIAFGFHHIGYFLKNITAFYFSAFIIAGGALGLQYFFQDVGLGGIYQQSLSLPTTLSLAIILPAAYILFRFNWRHSVRQQQIATQFVQVSIHIDDIVRCCTGLIDTGNHLRDPLGGSPVIITEANLWEGILPLNWVQQLESKHPFIALSTRDETEKKNTLFDQARLRIIPYRGINQSMQWMLGFRPDYVTISMDCTTYTCKQVIIGLDKGILSQDGAYQAIVHPHFTEQATKTTGSSILESVPQSLA